MAVFSGYPQNVTFSSVTIAKGGGSANLLVNPRGKVNQLNEAQGVVAAGQYFCDGWKAGAAGAQVYVDADGIRLISGSIIQLVPNTIEAGRNLRANMDVISGAPVLSINGGTDNEPNGSGAYIQLEISGDNSKFTRVILAESVDLPIYQQSSDELTPCLDFLFVSESSQSFFNAQSNAGYANYQFSLMHKVPAVSVGSLFSGSTIHQVSKNKVQFYNGAQASYAGFSGGIKLDARP
ncbi:hypothetical protein [Vibrio fluvialis]|uniref:hypothetical protein n=1 Tax=Vibrio fluvialis TaxID=676 RepID=UPI0024DF4524|nr:hypothetical protein [Vibrio fluvialis]WIE05915.1 hypothetical protein QN061_18040 [Vibrio fluvialis]